MSAIVFLPLGKGHAAVIDFVDFDKVRDFVWCAQRRSQSVHAFRSDRRADGRRTRIYLHNFLLPNVGRVDHRDGDGLNNQRDNLRPASTQQNGRGFRHKAARATSQFRGVSWNSRKQKWIAGITVNYATEHLGGFTVEQDAARAYDVAARKHFGQFATPNFPL